MAIHFWNLSIKYSASIKDTLCHKQVCFIVNISTRSHIKIYFAILLTRRAGELPVPNNVIFLHNLLKKCFRVLNTKTKQRDKVKFVFILKSQNTLISNHVPMWPQRWNSKSKRKTKKTGDTEQCYVETVPVKTVTTHCGARPVGTVGMNTTGNLTS